MRKNIIFSLAALALASPSFAENHSRMIFDEAESMVRSICSPLNVIEHAANSRDRDASSSDPADNVDHAFREISGWHRMHEKNMRDEQNAVPVVGNTVPGIGRILFSFTLETGALLLQGEHGILIRPVDLDENIASQPDRETPSKNFPMSSAMLEAYRKVLNDNEEALARCEPFCDAHVEPSSEDIRELRKIFLGNQRIFSE